MRTLLFILSGLILAGGACLLIKLFPPRYPRVSVVISRGFTLLWLLIALQNMIAGVVEAGYGIGEEFIIFSAIFLIPAAAFFWLRKR